jgi:hypothetical protein
MLAAAIKNWTKSGSFRALGTLLGSAMGHRKAIAFMDHAAIAFAEFCSVSEIGLRPRSLKMRSPSQQRNRLPPKPSRDLRRQHRASEVTGFVTLFCLDNSSVSRGALSESRAIERGNNFSRLGI